MVFALGMFYFRKTESGSLISHREGSGFWGFRVQEDRLTLNPNPEPMDYSDPHREGLGQGYFLGRQVDKHATLLTRSAVGQELRAPPEERATGDASKSDEAFWALKDANVST